MISGSISLRPNSLRNNHVWFVRDNNAEPM